MPPDPPETNLHLLMNQVDPMPTSNGYAKLYSSYSDDDSELEEMVSSDKTVKYINTYSVVPLN